MKALLMSMAIFLFAGVMQANSNRCDIYKPNGISQCGCHEGYCWAYTVDNSSAGDGWCYTQLLGVAHGNETWATCSNESLCFWEMTCGNDTVHYGDD